MLKKRIGFGPLTLVCLIGILVLLAMTGCSGADLTPTLEAQAAKTTKPTFTPVPTWTLVPTATTLPTLAPTTEPTATMFVTATPFPPPTLGANLNPLTGLPVSDPALLQRRILAARIGNDPLIRPQDGLGQADIVYEEIMEGWTLTRFTALYLGTDVARIRPLRSARLSSIEIATQWDAALVHSGASDKIRWLISQASFVDLDQFYHDQPYRLLDGYDWRGRMYTAVEDIHAYLETQGKDDPSAIAPLPFDATLAQGPQAQSIHIPYPETCVVDWAYDADTGLYLRSQQGEIHQDGWTDEPISAANVILLYAEHRKTDIVEDSLGSTAIDIRLDTTGRAQVCRDGVVIDGTWKRIAQNQPIQFMDTAGAVIALKPGQTWIQLVPTDYAVGIN